MNTDIPERALSTPTSQNPGGPDTQSGGDILGHNQRQLGRYSLLRQLKKERDSVTLLALDPVMHREVVLKVVRLPPPSDNARGGDAEVHTLEQAFVRQAQAAGRLHHPHIVTVFEAARVHNLAFLAVERVAGRALHELLASGWRPEPIHCASLTARIADAIEYAHSQNIAHGHLGPQHIILQPNGTPRVEGFGGWIDGGAAGDEALAHTEKLLPYFQNELTEDMRRLDVRAVVTLLHMMLCGKPPQQQRDHNGRPVILSINALRPDTPPELAQLIDETTGALAHETHRTAGDVRDALTAYIWNARKSHVAPATIGIPLAAPPETPSDIPPDDLAIKARPSKTKGNPPPPTITRTITGAPTRSGTWPSAEPATLAPTHEPATSTSTALRLPESKRFLRWILANRLALIGAGALIIIGIVVGLVLGRQSPIEQTPLPASTPDAAMSPASLGIVYLDIAPWGEVFVDGKPTGVSPPLTELKLPTGAHTIEIRYTGAIAVSADVNVQAGQRQAIRHRFE